MSAPKKLSRRDFLRNSAAVAAGALAAAAPIAASARPVAQEPQELLLWFFVNADRARLEEIAASDTPGFWEPWMLWATAAFEDANPDVKIRWEDHGWDEPLRTGLLTAIAGGTAPDVAHGEAFVQEFAALGAFNPVNVNLDDFPFGCIAGTLKDGIPHGAPMCTSSFALEINRTVLEKSGLDPDGVPATWEELVENSAKVFEAGNNGADWFGFTVYGPTPTRTYGAALRAMPWVNRTGALMGSDDGLTATFNDPRGVVAYQMLRDLFATTDPGVSLSEDEQRVGGALWDGLAAYQVSAAWDAGSAFQRGADTVHVPIPMCNTEDCVAGNVVLGNLTFSPVASGKNPDAGVRFVEFIASEDAQWQIARVLGNFLPANKKVLSDPELVNAGKYAGYEANTQVHINVLLNEETHPTPPFQKNASRIWTSWSDMLGRILLEDVDIVQELDQFQADAERLLR